MREQKYSNESPVQKMENRGCFQAGPESNPILVAREEKCIQTQKKKKCCFSPRSKPEMSPRLWSTTNDFLEIPKPSGKSALVCRHIYLSFGDESPEKKSSTQNRRMFSIRRISGGKEEEEGISLYARSISLTEMRATSRHDFLGFYPFQRKR